jgi:hypothetical protein
MTEEIRQRQYIKGMRLLSEAFDTLREPLDIDEQPEIEREEAKIASLINGAREQMDALIYKRQQGGINAAPEEEL